MRQIAIATVIVFLGLIASASGCTSAPPTPVDAGGDASPGVNLPEVVDVSPSIDDGALEAGGLDVPGVDVPAAVDVPASCTTNAACAGSAEGPACDSITGRCVHCTAASDLCPAGQYCVPGMTRCAPGCRDDLACREARDGGVVERRCNPDTRACVDCLRDEHCAAGSLCVGNTCVPGCTATRACPSGQTCCGGACADPQTSIASCGACDRRCTVTNGVPVCRSGACGLATCTAPFADCDGNAMNGCETNTATSGSHCGACGSACAARPNSTVSCELGSCRYSCGAGFGDCDGNAANGCETDLSTTPAHCGTCGRECSLSNAIAGCALGACTVASCAPGFGNCNGNAADGCEVDVRTSLANCGMCGRVCTLASASSVCSAGTCAISTCNAGYGNCDGDPSNGCEANLSTLTHCGRCGAACPTPAGPHTIARCTSTGGSATCGILCESGWRDCDGNLTNGCEVTGSCTVERALFSDNFMTGAANWILSNNGTAAFGMSYAQGYCRNPSHCFGCAVCIAASSYCPNQATATLRTTFDFSRVVSGTYSFYSLGSPGPSDRFIVEASTDGGGTWTSLSTPLPSACCIDSSASAQRVDLTPLAGARSVQFRFLFDNQCDSERFGTTWYVDDVTITALERTY